MSDTKMFSRHFVFRNGQSFVNLKRTFLLDGVEGLMQKIIIYGCAIG